MAKPTTGHCATAREAGQGWRVEYADQVQAHELTALLLRHKPRILHFAGHGNRDDQLIVEGEGRGERRKAIWAN